ncbi:hypothetical protein RND71_021515 [Anisodus tanguticus]|uniref:Uncharacterized protein n=1 Tax=Anisodus tanguticus TaxID=243964 RepID=A0AAE1RYJ4_9SOLA|nr:hypothetical protein RND71_021515 [Anisodus tanguticus]
MEGFCITYVESSEYFISMEVTEGGFTRTYLPERGELINKTNSYALVELDGNIQRVSRPFPGLRLTTSLVLPRRPGGNSTGPSTLLPGKLRDVLR